MPSAMRYARVGVTMLSVHDHRDPSDADWTEYVEAYEAAARDHGVRGLLAVSRGGGPNARQRKHVVDRLGRYGYIKTAVCSSSAIARGITTAIGWLTPAQLKGFGYAERDAALAWL